MPQFEGSWRGGSGFWQGECEGDFSPSPPSEVLRQPSSDRSQSLFWWWRLSFSAMVFAVFESEAFAVELEDVNVVSEAIEQRPSQALGAEHAGPLVEGERQPRHWHRVALAAGIRRTPAGRRRRRTGRAVPQSLPARWKSSQSGLDLSGLHTSKSTHGRGSNDHPDMHRRRSKLHILGIPASVRRWRSGLPLRFRGRGLLRIIVARAPASFFASGATSPSSPLRPGATRSVMNRILKLCATGLFVLVAAVPLYLAVGVFCFNQAGLPLPGIEGAREHIHHSAVLLLGGFGIWSMLEYRRVQAPTSRRVFLSVMIGTALVCLLEILSATEPTLGRAMHPVITVLSYVLGILIVWALAASTSSRRSAVTHRAP
jgi:hypothetical protein